MSCEVTCFAGVLRLCGWRCLTAHAVQKSSGDSPDGAAVHLGSVDTCGGQHISEAHNVKSPGFSLANWQVRLAERCSQHKLPCDQQVSKSDQKGSGKSSGEASDGQGILRVHAQATTSVSNKDQHKRGTAVADLWFLSGYFKNRNRARRRSILVELASVLHENLADRDPAPVVISQVRTDLLELTAETWSLLQQRHPDLHPAQLMPILDAPLDCSSLLRKYAKPLKHQTLSSPSSCSTASGHTGPFRSPTQASIPSTSTDPFPSPTLDGKDWTHLERTSTDELSSRFSDSTLCSASTRDRLLKVVEIEDDEDTKVTGVDKLTKVEGIDDDDDRWLHPLVGSTLSSVCNCDCTGRQKGKGASKGASLDSRIVPSLHDDWELHYMVMGTLDEVVCLLQRDASDQSIGNALLHLEDARERVLEWTVKRWHDCA